MNQSTTRLIPAAVLGVLVLGYLTYDAILTKTNEAEVLSICGTDVLSDRTKLDCHEVPDETTFHLTKLHELDEIWFYDSDVGATTWNRLSELEHLESVTVINKYPKRVRDLEALTSLDQLERLNISGGEIEDEDLSKFSSLTSLRELRLDRNELTGKNLTSLTVLPLRSISLDRNPLLASELDVLLEIETLREIEMTSLPPEIKQELDRRRVIHGDGEP